MIVATLSLLLLQGPPLGRDAALARPPAELATDLQRWVRRVELGYQVPEAADLRGLQALAREVRSVPDRILNLAVIEGLLDLSVLEARVETPALEAARALGRELLEDALERGEALAESLARDVLVRRSQPLERRLAAAALLEERYRPGTQLALLTLAAESEPALREAALRALSGWPDPLVHACFLDVWERAAAGPDLARSAERALEAHLHRLARPLEGEPAARLARGILPRLLSEDWRAAVRAARLSAALPEHLAVPMLIESMSAWQARTPSGRGSLRVETDLARELEARSGLRIGPRPKSWRLWWQRVQDGEPGFAGPGSEELVTRATFFGLRPESDRVVLVIDRSGSMAADGGRKSERSRYEEAQHQLQAFLRQAGERTRFGVALFNDRGDLWKRELVPADERRIDEALRWIRGRSPTDGTSLSAGLAAALQTTPAGSPDLASLEADTLIVLCDGATEEDGAWARRWLERVNAEAELRIHCVQIGAGASGVLETLAEGSGGDLVRVEG